MLPDCDYQKLGLAALSLQQENNGLRSDLNFTSKDTLMDGFLTAAGFELALTKPSALRDQLHEEIADGRTGVLMLDVRGLSFINNQFDHTIGNAFLQIVGHRIKQVVRTTDQPYHGQERRHDESASQDTLFFRKGGDEVGVVMHSIGKTDFAKRKKDLSTALSITRALENPHEVPVIASVGGMHITETTLPHSWDDDTGVRDAAQKLIKAADMRANRSRDVQYETMRRLVLGQDPALANTLRSNDSTGIAEYFFTKCFPDFAVNVEPRVQAAVEEIEHGQMGLKSRQE
jgi:GGDEF domain-containing protein